MHTNIGSIALRHAFAANRIRSMKWMKLTCLIAALFVGGTSPVNASLMTFDFFFNGKGQSGSGVLEATENKDGSFTAVSGFVRTFNNDSAAPLWEFEQIYNKRMAEVIEKLEKGSSEDMKGAEYLKVFSDSKDQGSSLSFAMMFPEEIEKLEKISRDEVKGSEYFNLFENSKGSEASYSPSGYFFYDNLLYPSNLDLLVGNPGLLFMSEKGKELNLFSSGPSSYLNYQNDGFNIQTSFHLIAVSDYLPPSELPDSSMINAVPEPSTLALLGLGLIGLYSAHRKSNSRTKTLGA
jgi:hypothetical protein